MLVTEHGYSKKVDPSQYQSMVGSLSHVPKAKCPDIAHAVGKVSRVYAAPTQVHLTAPKRIFRYLKGTIDLLLQHGWQKAVWILRCRLGQ